MAKRRRIRSVAVALVVASVAILIWHRPGARFGLDRYNRINGGMTMSEVCAIFGPPGNYRTGPEAYARELVRGEDLTGDPGTTHFLFQQGNEFWCDDDGCIAVCFDSTGLSTYKFHMPRTSSFESFRDRFKAQWRRWFR